MPARIPSYVPEGGWTSSTFKGGRGRRLILDWVETERRYKRAGINKMLKVLKEEHVKFFDDVIRKGVAANKKSARLGSLQKAPQTITVKPVGNLDAWASVINSEAEKLNLNLSAKATPIYENVATGVYEAVSVRLGSQPPKHEILKQQYRGRLLAQKVTNVTQTTKNKMHKVIKDAMEEGLTVPEVVKRLREKFPTIASNRFPTIARTEMGRAADTGTKAALKESQTVLEVSVIGCEAVEPGIPTYKGKPTCNIQGVPKEDVDKLEFHINHTGAIVPSKFIDDKDLPSVKPDEIKDDPKPKLKPKPPSPVEAVIAPTTPSVPVEEITAVAALMLRAKRRVRTLRKKEPRQQPTVQGDLVDMKDPRNSLGQFRKLEEMSLEEWQSYMLQLKDADQLDFLEDVEFTSSRFLNTNTDAIDIAKVEEAIDRYGSLMEGGVELPASAVAIKSSRGQYTLITRHEDIVAQSLLGLPIKVRVFDPKKNPLKPDPTPEALDTQLPAATSRPLVNTGEFPQSLDNLEEVRKLGGSTGAKLVRDPDSGKLFVMKKGADGPHLEEEMLADSLYRAAGVDVPEFRRYLDSGGRPVKLAEFIDGDLLSDLPANKRREAFKKLQEDFGLDAFLANWDVGGMNLDNIIVDSNGKVWRIDNGGSLRFRAQGAKKDPKVFNAFSEDLWTMREDGNVASSIFKEMDWDQIEQSLTKIDFDKILDGIEDKELRELMSERALQLRRTARMARNYRNGAYTSEYRDTQLRMGMKLRKNGMSPASPTEMKSSPADAVRFRDSEKGLWGGLLDESANMTAPTSTGVIGDPDDIFPEILAAVKTLKHHADKGDFEYNGQSVANYGMKVLDAPDSVKEHYKEVIDWVGSAVEASIKKDKSFFDKNPVFVEKMPKPKNPTPTKPATEKTAMQVLQDTAMEIFGDKYYRAGAAVAEWKTSQASSSWGGSSMVHSYFQMKKTGLTKEGDVFLKGFTLKNLDEQYKLMANRHGLTIEEFETAMGLQHQWTQEILEHTRFTGNDWERGVVLLRRTAPPEEFGVASGSDLKVGNYYDAAAGQRGPNVSSSIAQNYALNSTNVSEQAVPHSRITGLYWTGRSWTEPENNSFAGIGENEFTFFAPNIPMVYRGDSMSTTSRLTERYTSGKVGTDASKWDVPLDHIKKFLKRMIRKLYVKKDCSCHGSH